MNKIEIDRQSGCCFGVAKAIAKAEEELKKEVHFIVWVILCTTTSKWNVWKDGIDHH